MPPTFFWETTMPNEDFDVKDFFGKLKHVFEQTDFKKAFEEIEKDLNKSIPLEEDLKKYGFSGEQGRLKKRIFDSAYNDWKLNKKNSQILRKLLSIVSILLESLSHLGPIFEAINELVKLFKLCLEKVSKVKHITKKL